MSLILEGLCTVLPYIHTLSFACLLSPVEFCLLYLLAWPPLHKKSPLISLTVLSKSLAFPIWFWSSVSLHYVFRYNASYFALLHSLVFIRVNSCHCCLSFVQLLLTYWQTVINLPLHFGIFLFASSVIQSPMLIQRSSGTLFISQIHLI